MGGPPTSGGSKGPNTGLIVILGLLVAAVVAGGIFLVASGGDDDDAQTTDTTETTDDNTVSTEDNTPESTEDDNSGGGEISDSDLADATDALDAFMAAELDSDCATMYTLASETLAGAASQDEWIAGCQEEYDSYSGMSVDGEAEVVGSTEDSVDFEVPQTISDTELTATYTLINENGQWLVDDFGSI